MHRLPKTVTRQRRGCDLNAGPSARESRSPIFKLLNFKIFRSSLRSYKVFFAKFVVTLS